VATASIPRKSLDSASCNSWLRPNTSSPARFMRVSSTLTLTRRLVCTDVDEVVVFVVSVSCSVLVLLFGEGVWDSVVVTGTVSIGVLSVGVAGIGSDDWDSVLFGICGPVSSHDVCWLVAI